MLRRALLLSPERPDQYRPAERTMAPAGMVTVAVEELAGALPPTGSVLMYTMSRSAFWPLLPVPPWWPAQLLLPLPLVVLQVSRPLPTITTSPLMLKLCCCTNCACASPGTSASMKAAVAITRGMRHARWSSGRPHTRATVRIAIPAMLIYTLMARPACTDRGPRQRHQDAAGHDKQAENCTRARAPMDSVQRRASGTPLLLLEC